MVQEGWYENQPVFINKNNWGGYPSFQHDIGTPGYLLAETGLFIFDQLIPLKTDPA